MLVLDQHGYLHGCSLGVAGSGHRDGAAAACVVSSLVVSVQAARPPWRPVPAPAAGVAPLVDLVMKLGEVHRGERDTQLVVVHVDSRVVGVSGRTLRAGYGDASREGAHASRGSPPAVCLGGTPYPNVLLAEVLQ